MSKDSIKLIKKTLIWILKWAIFTACLLYTSDAADDAVIV